MHIQMQNRFSFAIQRNNNNLYAILQVIEEHAESKYN
jgi:hypothetical protein